MILGVGHDLVHVPRIEALLARWDQRFVDRIFTAGEQQYCLGFVPAVRAQHYAVRFAAKEACYKALSQGRSLGIWFQDIEVLSAPGAGPRLGLSPRAQQHADDAGVRRSHLSLSHDGDYASAVVILEGDAPPP